MIDPAAAALSGNAMSHGFTQGADQVTTSTTILGSNESDVLWGGDDNELFEAGNGDDVVWAGAGDDEVEGGNGDDTLLGEAGEDVLIGGNGSDELYGGEGDDALFGGNGRDVLFGGAGNDHIDGGNGTDTVMLLRRLEQYLFARLADGAIQVIDLANGEIDTVFNAELFQFEDRLLGVDELPLAAVLTPNDEGGFDIELTNPLALNEALGSSGTDKVIFDANEDGATIALPNSIENIAITGVANANAVGNANNNTMLGNAGNNVLDGGDGDDTLVGGSGEGDDTYIGGAGTDTVVYSSATQSITVNLAEGWASGAEIGNDTLISIENVVGGSGNDTLIGDAGPNALYGGHGNDVLGGGPGDDLLDGGAGFDTVRYGMAGTGVTVDLRDGFATVGGTNDTLVSIEAASGSPFNDVLRGNAENNVLEGGNGNDVLVGRFGDDSLIGGTGIDRAVFSGSRAEYSFGQGLVSGPNGTDSTSSVELLQFDDAFMMGFGITPINLTSYSFPNSNPIFGRLVDDLLTVGTNANFRAIDLGEADGDNDTLTLGIAGQSYILNLTNVETLNGSFGDETVTMMSAVSDLSVDLSFGLDTLHLSNANDSLTVRNVEAVFGYGGTDTLIFVHDDVTAGQSFDLGFGENDVLTLAGSESNFSIAVGGDMTVVGATDSGNEVVNLLSVQGGSTFDLGAGEDALHLYSDGQSFNVVTVRNVEHVTAVGFGSDQIHIAGNSGAATTVTAGGGADQVWASADIDHIRFTMAGDSPFDFPLAGARDLITGFDASQDRLVFDGPEFSGSFAWRLVEFGGADVVLIDLGGDGTDDADSDGQTGDYGNFDMAIGLDGLVGTLGASNFVAGDFQV